MKYLIFIPYKNNSNKFISFKLYNNNKNTIFFFIINNIINYFFQYNYIY